MIRSFGREMTTPIPLSDPGALRATTRLLEEDVDLNDVAGGDGFLFVREGVGFAGQGVAGHMRSDEAEEFLRSIPHENHSDLDVAPVALGILPFAPDRPAHLVLPRLTVGKDAEGRAWMTTIDPDSPALRLAPPPRIRAS
ncbi:MAG: hypothetical protein ACKOA6_08035, partial [Actinomycetota bacterium]